MIIGLKDSLKLIGIIIVSFCAVFVCTFFLNFYLDAKSIEHLLATENEKILYNAQMSTAKFTCSISGGFLALIAVVMLVFYLKLYINSHCSQLGVLKAMGYSDCKISLRFCVFGVSVFIGTALGFCVGFAYMPKIYESLTVDGLPEVAINFHPVLLIVLVFMPTVFYSALSVLFAFYQLKRPVLDMLLGKTVKEKKEKIVRKDKDRSFLSEIFVGTLKTKKLLSFFIAFACFCFSAMVQMGFSMKQLSSEEMGIMILLIGIVLAVTTLFMATTTVLKNNVKNVSIMKAFGYSMKEYSFAVLSGYNIFAFVGFAVGTVYQYVLLKLMVGVIYKDVAAVTSYNFDIPLFFITLAVFTVLYEGIMAFYAFRMSRISVKEVMTEN